MKFATKSIHSGQEADKQTGSVIVPIYQTLYPLEIIYYCISSFLLFRFFDIWKPYPISYVDENVKGALGIMLDDILAGTFSIICLLIIFFFIGG